MAETMQTVAQNVKYYRELKGWTYADLDRALKAAGHKLNVAALTRIENGTRRFNVDDLAAFAHVLGVSPVDLLTPAVINHADFIMSEYESVTTFKPVTPLEARAWITGELTSLEPEARLEFTRKQLIELDKANAKIEKDVKRANINGNKQEAYELLGDQLSMEAEIAYLIKRCKQLEKNL